MKVEPSAAALLEIARTAILSDIAPALSEAQRYAALMAANALAIAGRDLAAEDAGATELAGIAALLPDWSPESGAPDALREGTARLAARIREGRFDEGPARTRLLEHLRETVRARSRSAIPGRSPATKGPRRDRRSALRHPRQGRPRHWRLQRLGEHFARCLAGRGATVVAAARRADRIERLVAGIRAEGGIAHAVVLDVTDPSSVDAAVGQASELAGPLDILVNNAGIADTKASIDLTEADWRAFSTPISTAPGEWRRRSQDR